MSTAGMHRKFQLSVHVFVRTEALVPTTVLCDLIFLSAPQGSNPSLPSSLSLPHSLCASLVAAK